MMVQVLSISDKNLLIISTLNQCIDMWFLFFNFQNKLKELNKDCFS